MRRAVVVVDYDHGWPREFEGLRRRFAAALDGLAIAIEHVGSTAVPGLAAKPIIDISVVVPGPGSIPEAIDRLAAIGYLYLGDLGVEGREAFRAPQGGSEVDHNLYLCPDGSLGLRNHLAVRDHLRSNPEVARQYGELKRELASRFADDIDAYVDGKTGLLIEILGKAGLDKDEVERIARSNRLPPLP